MNNQAFFTSAEELISATELTFETHENKSLNSNTFGINTALSFINFGCIKDTDNVLIMSSEIDAITYGVSYIYTPNELTSYKINPSYDPNSIHSLSHTAWNTISELLINYPYTLPNFVNVEHMDEIQCTSDYFHVSIAAFTCNNNMLRENDLGRFNLTTGIEHDIFEKLLIKSSQSLKNTGVLLILCRPGWVLKSWQLIHDLNLQLEYENYSLYTDEIRHANTLIWLRFTKNNENFNLDTHKRNILSLMKDNFIDRLYAHRNNLIFPYVELSYSNSESFVNLDQNLEYMQYFFSAQTTKALAQLCKGYTACLVTPSIAKYACSLNKNVVLFERDNRFRQNEGLTFVKYDLNKGLTKFTANKYAQAFDTVICDPPFDIKLNTLADDITELLKPSRNVTVYIVFPSSRSVSLINAMKTKGLQLAQNDNTTVIEYSKPPKIVRLNGKQAIQLYKFAYVT